MEEIWYFLLQKLFGQSSLIFIFFSFQYKIAQGIFLARLFENQSTPQRNFLISFQKWNEIVCIGWDCDDFTWRPTKIRLICYILWRECICDCALLRSSPPFISSSSSCVYADQTNNLSTHRYHIIITCHAINNCWLDLAVTIRNKHENRQGEKLIQSFCLGFFWLGIRGYSCLSKCG